MMESQELRARALDAAVRIGAAWKMESAGDIVATARVFEQYLIGHLHRLQGNAPIKARFINDPSPHDVGHAEDIWGPPCNGCTHSTGVHVSSGCTDPECGCIRMSGECAQPSAPAPDALCLCDHPRSAHSGRDSHCTSWLDAGHVCTCQEYTP